MFPQACLAEVQHCLAVAEGDPGRAAQLVLHRQEAGQSILPSAAVLQVDESESHRGGAASFRNNFPARSLSELSVAFFFFSRRRFAKRRW